MAFSATLWPQALDNLKYNLSSTTVANATSVAAGEVVAGDIFQPFLIGDGRVGMIMGDCIVASAAGQVRSTSLSANGFLRNALLMYSGTDPSTADITTHHGNPGNHGTADMFPFFPHRQTSGTNFWRYPFGGISLPSGRLLCTGMFCRDKLTEPSNLSTSMSGTWGILYDNVQGEAPEDWEPREKDFELPMDSFHAGGFGWHGMMQPIDGGDGYAYVGMTGPSRSNIIGFCRFDLDQADGPSKKIRIEWLAPNATWREDKPNYINNPYESAKYGHAGMERHRHNRITFGIDGTDQLGGLHKRADGKWQLTMIPDFFPVRPGDVEPDDPRVQVSIANNITDLFTTMQQVYDIPVVNNRFYYGAYTCPEFTWSGKTANQSVVLYSHNGGGGVSGVFSDAREYWPEFLKVTET